MNLIRIFVNQIIFFLDSYSAGYHSIGFYRKQIMIGWLIEAEWRIYVSARYSIIGSNNGLLPYWCQDIIGTNADLLLIGLLGTNLKGNFNLFILENTFENVACEIVDIWFGLGLNVLR